MFTVSFALEKIKQDTYLEDVHLNVIANKIEVFGNDYVNDIIPGEVRRCCRGLAIIPKAFVGRTLA
jgi:hypothetical protein